MRSETGRIFGTIRGGITGDQWVATWHRPSSPIRTRVKRRGRLADELVAPGCAGLQVGNPRKHPGLLGVVFRKAQNRIQEGPCSFCTDNSGCPTGKTCSGLGKQSSDGVAGAAVKFCAVAAAANPRPKPPPPPATSKPPTKRKKKVKKKKDD